MNQLKLQQAALFRPENGVSAMQAETASFPAAEGAPHGVSAEKTADRITLGNDLLRRGFSLKNGHAATCDFTNLRTQGESVLVPAPGSEEFQISTADGTQVNASAFTLSDLRVFDLPDAAGKGLLFCFAPCRAAGVEWQVEMAVTMRDGEHVMRKSLSIRVPEQDAGKVRIDRIDLEHVAAGGAEHTWTHPDMEPANISGFHMGLGQPVYLDALFLGCEFPACDNQLENGVARMRYITGKTPAQMEKDADGRILTWPTVVGAARSADLEVLRSDFFEYIEAIAVPIYFRKQYNSWYDHMMDISAENIEGSFYEIEKGLTQHGVEPVDSYVVDDGWNDYTKDFWCFNEKFPNELYDSSALAEKFFSNFGLWLGPRGGYNTITGKFGKQMERAGTGGYNKEGNDVCIFHPEYIRRIKAFFLDYMDRFDINYWKLDGFALQPCTNAKHGHMVGGEHGMYATTELWEGWLEIFEAMHLNRTSKGKDLWINFTSYANPSPWYLQWVNSVWLQNSGDVGFQRVTTNGKPLSSTDKDKMLSYRDDRYFNFLKVRDLQFPLGHIYNHDPIYGNTANVKLSTEEFREYLFMMATRGTSFWELYYSYNMMDEAKWQITAEVLAWLGENFHVLRKAKLIGETPAGGHVYGYSSWDGQQGVVSLRNPGFSAKSFTVTLDRLIGVPEGMQGLSRTYVLPNVSDVDGKIYSYGDTITVEIPAHSAQIWQFGPKDARAPRAVEWHAVSDRTITITFDKRVAALQQNFNVAGNTLESAVLQANYRTVLLTFARPFAPGAEFTLAIDGVKDMSANSLKTSIPMTYYPQEILLQVSKPSDLADASAVSAVRSDSFGIDGVKLAGKGAVASPSGGVSGCGGFTVRLAVNTTSASALLVEQEGAMRLALDEAGKAVFTVNGLSVVSKSPVNSGTWRAIWAVKENNGMLKLYVDGLLEASSYDRSNRNPVFSRAAVTLGGDAFTGAVAGLTLVDRAFGFDEIAEQARRYGLPVKEFQKYCPPQKKKSKKAAIIGGIVGGVVAVGVIATVLILNLGK